MQKNGLEIIDMEIGKTVIIILSFFLSFILSFFFLVDLQLD